MNPELWIGLLTLTVLEIVLGIDNIVFIAILAGKLPSEKQPLAYRLGLSAALISRLLLLFTISWVMTLTRPLFSVFETAISGRDLILIAGGLFLIAKSAHEIYDKVEGPSSEQANLARPGAHVTSIVLQIMVLDVVFSLDSVITAVGMVEDIRVMVAAVVLAVGIMLIFAKPIGDFVNLHPSVKVLALAFLLLIGVVLVADGLHQHINKGYIYFGMGFALLIELLHIRARARTETS